MAQRCSFAIGDHGRPNGSQNPLLSPHLSAEHNRDGSEECWKDQARPLDLHELLTEIQSLRRQLERSIEANQALHGKLEEQLLRGKRDGGSSGSTLSIGYLFKQESQHYAAINGELCPPPPPATRGWKRVGQKRTPNGK